MTTCTYSASGDLLLVTDSAGTETSYEYDSLHRLVQVTEDDGGISAETRYIYDAVGNAILIGFRGLPELKEPTSSLKHLIP